MKKQVTLMEVCLICSNESRAYCQEGNIILGEYCSLKCFQDMHEDCRKETELRFVHEDETIHEFVLLQGKKQFDNNFKRVFFTR